MAVSHNDNIQKTFTEGTAMNFEPTSFRSRNKSPPSAEVPFESNIPNNITEDVARLVYSDVNLTILDRIDGSTLDSPSLKQSAGTENETFSVSNYLSLQYKKPNADYGISPLCLTDFPSPAKDFKKTIINIQADHDLSRKCTGSLRKASLQTNHCNSGVNHVPEDSCKKYIKVESPKTSPLKALSNHASPLRQEKLLTDIDDVEEFSNSELGIKHDSEFNKSSSLDASSCDGNNEDPVIAASMKQSLERKLKKIIADQPSDKLSASHLISSLSVKLSKKLSKDNSIAALRTKRTRKNSDNFRFLRQTSSGRIVKRTRLASTIDHNSALSSRRKVTLIKSSPRLRSLISSKSKSHNKRKIKLINKKTLPKVVNNLLNRKKSNSKIAPNSSNLFSNSQVNKISNSNKDLSCENLSNLRDADTPSPGNNSPSKRKIPNCVNSSSPSHKRQKLCADSQTSNCVNNLFNTSAENGDAKLLLESDVKPSVQKNLNAPDDDAILSSPGFSQAESVIKLEKDCTETFSPVNEELNSLSVVSKTSSSDDVKLEEDNQLIRHQNKHSRLRSEIRVLIEESIKATKTIGTPLGKIRKSKYRGLPNKRKTECDILLEMLSEIRSPHTVTRLKTRRNFIGKKNPTSTSKAVMVKENSSGMPQTTKFGRIVKNVIGNKEGNSSENCSKPSEEIGSKKIKSGVKPKQKMTIMMNDSKKKISKASSHVPSQSQKTKEMTKKAASTLASQKKKAIKMKLELEKKKNNKEQTIGKNASGKSSSSISLYCKSPVSSPINQLNSNFLLRFPVVTLSPASVPQEGGTFPNDSSTKTVIKTSDLNKSLYKKNKRNPCTIRYTEPSCKFKDITLRFQKNFVQVLIMSNTQIKNGLNPRVLKELKTALINCKKDKNCRLVLLSSTGSIFCSGVDLSFLIKDNKIQRQKAATEMIKAIKEFTTLLIAYPKPIVVAVNGAAVGLGMMILTLCDVVYASDKATFYAPYSALGQVPEGCATVMLPLCMDMAIVGDIFLGTRRLTAEEACQRGLVSKVFWPSTFFEEVIPRVEKMASQNNQAMESTKTLLRQRLRVDLEKALEKECEMLLTQWCSPECQKAMKTFLEQEEII